MFSALSYLALMGLSIHFALDDFPYLDMSFFLELQYYLQKTVELLWKVLLNFHLHKFLFYHLIDCLVSKLPVVV